MRRERLLVSFLSWKLISRPGGTSRSFLWLSSLALRIGMTASTVFASTSRQLYKHIVLQ